MALGSSIAKCHDFSVRASDWLGLALAEYQPVRVNQQATDGRIG
jgi:hypothetical protein